ncbi:MAG: magnesium transporter CorA family protein [Acidobacteriota bacterium]|nr:magnesium transporter CorA family protein [Acidobacteriota bacterium]
MKTVVYLYDVDGTEREVDLDQGVINNLNDRQLLWVNILERDLETVKGVTTALKLTNVPIKGILRTHERPKIFKFQDFYHFFIVSVEADENGNIRSIPIDFVVGKNFVITVHEGDVKYLQDFVKREKGQRHIGELDSESFVATMLDLHIVSYFRILEKIERDVDVMDEKILEKDLEDEEFLKQMVGLRNEVSKLRRWFLPHRDIFYSLSRPDFREIAESDSYENFKTLNEHFESAVDSIESSRDTVLSLFDLYTTKNSHLMNKTIKRLTFITLLVGGLGAIAGVWGMNFEVEYFKSAETGFWLTISAMVFLILGLTTIAKLKNWI